MSLRLQLSAALLAVIYSAASHAAPLYQVTRLSEAATSASVTDLNNAGQAIGMAGTKRYLWGAAGATRLNDNFQASSINAHGVVVGTLFDIPNRTTEAMKYQNGIYTGLGTLVPELPSASGATAINNRGDIIGGSSNGDTFSWRTVRFGANGPESLRLPLQGDSPRDMNESGAIVGNFHHEDPFAGIFVTRTFVYDNGNLTKLPLMGSDSVVGSDINNANTVAGVIYRSSGGSVPFLYANGVVTELSVPGGTYSEAKGINNAGQVVGGFGNTWEMGHAFLYDGGTSYDIDTLLAPGSGLTIRSATAINDRGQIGAQGCDASGNCFAVLLSPVPEPQTWGMWLAGAGLIGWVARRRNRAGLAA